MPRRLDAIGLVVEAVDEFLGRYQAKEGCRNQVRWLSAPSR
jgi:hypothetical protein